MSAEDMQRRLRSEFPEESLGWMQVPGLGQRPVLCPTGIVGFQQALALAEQSNWILQVAGHGTRLGEAAPPPRVDLVLSTRGFSGVLAFEPGDGTLTARAGTRMQELRELTAGGGFALTPDVARPSEHTLGGILGAGISGIDRMARGPLRHHVLGMRVLLADGSLAKTGGRLVKNVTGYDLQRLYCGSRGGLCVILEASLRLFPESGRRAALRLPTTDLSAAVQQAQRIPNEGIAPQTLIAAPTADGKHWQVLLLLAGRAETVAQEIERVQGQWPKAEALSDEECSEQHERWRDALELDAKAPGLHLSTRPSRLQALLTALQDAPELQEHLASMFCQPCLASVHIQLDPSASEHRFPELNQMIAQLGASMHWCHANQELQREAFGPLGDSRKLMAGFKQALDPKGLFAGGAFLDKR